MRNDRWAEPYTIHIFAVDGDPDGVKIVDRQNWTGWGIAFPRSSWPSVSRRKEFGTPGVYILSGPGEGSTDECRPSTSARATRSARASTHTTRTRTSGTGATPSSPRARRSTVRTPPGSSMRSSTWRTKAGQCHLDNATHPKEPSLSEWERADTGFPRRDAPHPAPARRARVREARPGGDGRRHRVPARGRARGPARHRSCAGPGRRLPGGLLRRATAGTRSGSAAACCLASSTSLPIDGARSAVTHYAPVERIEPYGDGGKYRLVFAGARQGDPGDPLRRRVHRHHAGTALHELGAATEGCLARGPFRSAASRGTLERHDVVVTGGVLPLVSARHARGRQEDSGANLFHTQGRNHIANNCLDVAASEPQLLNTVDVGEFLAAFLKHHDCPVKPRWP